MKRRVIVYKYRLSSLGRTSVKMPALAQVLGVQNQDELVQVWALCDPEQKVVVPRTFVAFKTGDPIDLDEAAAFIGSVQLNAGRHVAHVFEVFEP